LFFVYFFLWSRQRAFFANHLLNVHYNRIIKILSYSFIVLIFGYTIFTMCYNSIPELYMSDRTGCLQRDINFGLEVYIIVGFGVTFSNFCLFGLFVYALTHIQSNQERKTLKSQRKTGKETIKLTKTNTASLSTDLQGNSSNEHIKIQSPKQIKSVRKKSSSGKITYILKKTLILAIISILVDVLLQVFVGFVIDTKGHRRVSNMVGDIAAFLNFFLILLSFTNYKEMMTSLCRKWITSVAFTLSGFNEQERNLTFVKISKL